MYPIPKEVLIHSCVLNNYSEEGAYGERKLISRTVLSNVRISVYGRAERDIRSRNVKRCGVLYFDCQNSSPEDAEFMGENFIGTISFNGEEYEITSVKYFYCGDELHHLEVGLGGET